MVAVDENLHNSKEEDPSTLSSSANSERMNLTSASPGESEVTAIDSPSPSADDEVMNKG